MNSEISLLRFFVVVPSITNRGHCTVSNGNVSENNIAISKRYPFFPYGIITAKQKKG